MKHTLAWQLKGHSFEDGSLLTQWEKVFKSSEWHWQYDTHELNFSIYRHCGYYWKLYTARYVNTHEADYRYEYGHLACRVILVEYTQKTKSPHSSKLTLPGEREWIRTTEFNPAIHYEITNTNL